MVAEFGINMMNHVRKVFFFFLMFYKPPFYLPGGACHYDKNSPLLDVSNIFGMNQMTHLEGVFKIVLYNPQFLLPVDAMRMKH